ncbi:dockerin type I domain-containing protein [Ruminiclostridium sufflavum]|nr:dockerin type I domain-containing protein [Ruminiclostridium sufflavum]
MFGKKVLAFVMVLSICLSICFICGSDNQALAAGTSESGLIGDLNGDGAIDALDYSLTKQMLLGLVTDLPVQNDLYAADVDGDGSVNALDLALQKQYLLGIIIKFPKTAEPSGPIVVMPLGDSITDGLTVAGGYRIKLWNTIVSNGQKVDFVGSMSNGPTELGDKNHEGHSGWRIDQIDAKINEWMTAYKPQIVMLHIGTNDIAQGYSVASAPDRLSALIDKICAKLPANGKLYVSSIIPLSMGNWNSQIIDYNSKIPGIVQSKATAGKPVYFVEMYSKITTADLADGVHCNRTGYDKMADVWYAAIKNDLPK